jgi:dolichol kinase
LLWLTTQIIAGYAVLIPMSLVFARYAIKELIFTPIVIHGLGDGLAEPIGMRFGRHKYTTRTFLSTKHTHTRSYEGSACVLVVGILAVLFFHDSFTSAELLAALLATPILTTLAEAWSPHTWDTPYMFLVSGGSLLAVKLWI